MASLDWNTIERGDFILILFKAIDEELQKIDHHLTIFFMGYDSYHFTVLNTADFGNVNGLNWSFYGVRGADCLQVNYPREMPQGVLLYVITSFEWICKKLGFPKTYWKMHGTEVSSNEIEKEQRK